MAGDVRQGKDVAPPVCLVCSKGVNGDQKDANGISALSINSRTRGGLNVDKKFPLTYLSS